jgi:hypothetical protein
MLTAQHFISQMPEELVKALNRMPERIPQFMIDSGYRSFGSWDGPHELKILVCKLEFFILPYAEREKIVNSVLEELYAECPAARPRHA